MQIEWWYWIIAGFFLIGLELIVPSFTISWFGLGALVVGVLSVLLPDFHPVGQIALWVFASVSFTLLWFKYLKPKGDRTLAGTPKEEIIGVSGTIIRGTKDGHGRGTVKFRTSVLGADEWGCCSSGILHVGDRVRVIDIEGELLNVEII